MKSNDYGDIFVIYYRKRYFCVDGHHRLFLLNNMGVTNIRVINEVADNENRLYQILADEAWDMGLRTIADLEKRIVSEADFKVLWIEKCSKIIDLIDGE